MQKPFQALQVIFVAFVGSTFVYLLVGLIVSRSGWKPILEPGLYEIFSGIFLLISVGVLILVQKLKRDSFSEGIALPASVEEFQKYATSRHIILFALSEVPAILGLVLFFLTGSLMRFAILIAISFASFVMARPAPDTLENIQKRLFP